MKIHANARENPSPRATKPGFDGGPRYARTVTQRSFRANAQPPATSPEPARFIDGYLAYLLAQASHRISGEFHREVEAAGLSVTEWRVLASLADGARETIGTLSQLTLTKQPTLSKIVQRMERQGLVMRGSMASDRRQTLVALTPQGQKVARRHLRRALGHQAQVLQPIDPQEAQWLIGALHRLMQLPPGPDSSAG